MSAEDSAPASTTDDGTASDTTEGTTSDPPSRDPPLRSPTSNFVDVTVHAGLAFDPGDLSPAPFCVLDDINNPESGDYCIPERFLGASAVGDYDGDQWPDVFFTRKDGPGLLMRNRGDGTFIDVTSMAGLDPPTVIGGAGWLDIEGDGDLDLMLTSFGGTRHYLYVNDGQGVFSEEAQERGAAVDTGQVHVGMGIAIGDYDLDGYIDLFVADWHSTLALGTPDDHNRLLHNRGAEAPGHFEDVTAGIGVDLYPSSKGGDHGVFGFAPAFVDLDGDRWPELALVADAGTSRLFWNEGAIGFVDLTEASGVGTETNGMGSAFGDYDGDGDLDWFVSSIWQRDTSANGNRLYRNEGDRTFTDVTNRLGVREGGWGWGTTWFDADLDGALDLALASGWPSTSFENDPVRLWLATHVEPWPEVASDHGIDFRRGGRSVVPFDYDRDGDLDLLVHANSDPPALYRNDTEGGTWLKIRTVGQNGNSQGIGVEVRVRETLDGPWQLRHIGVGGHFNGQSEAIAHFGLGVGDDPLYRVELTWPATGERVFFSSVRRNQQLVVHK